MHIVQTAPFDAFSQQLADRARPPLTYKTNNDAEPGKVSVGSNNVIYIHPDDHERFQTLVQLAGWEPREVR